MTVRAVWSRLCRGPLFRGFRRPWSSTRLVGTVKAREHYFIGDIIDGAATAALGLNRVVEDEAPCGETAARSR
jgi:hypothetical protein